MEAIIPKSELLRFGRILKAVKLTKAAKKASVTLIVAEHLSVIGPGFNQVLTCKPIKWGTVLLPFSAIESLIKVLKGIPEDEVAIEAENGRFKIARRMEMTGPEIKVSHKDSLPLEIPLDSRPVDFLKLFSHGPERLQNSGMWKPVLFYMTKLRQQLGKAALPLEEYGIRPPHLAIAVARKLDIENLREFVEILFSEQTKS
jgi:hypothetical protein